MGRHSGLDLLPTNRTGWGRAMSLTSAERDVDVQAFIDAFDADTCPVDLLPWLAVTYSVDIWREGWPEARKRDVIKRAVDLHRKKGTLAGLEEFVELADASVVSVLTPPSLFFASDIDHDAYADWLARLPEVRIYRANPDALPNCPGALAGDAVELLDLPDADILDDDLGGFLGEDVTDQNAFDPALFCLYAEDYPVSTLQAVLVENGVTTALELESGNEWNAARDALPIERVYFPETAGLDLYADDDASFLDTDFGYTSDGDVRHYAASVKRSVSGGAAAAPTATVRGRAVVDTNPVRVYTDQPSDATLFADADEFFDHTFTPDDDASATLYYDSWRLVDPKVTEHFGPDYSFLDYDRFSVPPFTAEALIDISETAPLDGWYLDAGPIGFALEPDLTKLWDVCDAVVIAKAARDDVLLDLDYQTRKPLRQQYSLADLKLR